MDSIRKKINHLDQPIFKLLLRLFTATFFYFFIIKKFLVFLFKEYILDYFVFISNTMEINIILVGDDIKIKSSVDHIESFYMSLPFNAFYSSKFPEGIVMNEILTEKQIFETYNKVK